MCFCQYYVSCKGDFCSFGCISHFVNVTSWRLKNASIGTEVVDIANLIITEFIGQKVAFPQKSPTKVNIKLGISIKRGG